MLERSAAVSWGLAIMTLRKPRFQSGCQQLVITVVLKVWLSDSCMMKTGSCAFGFEQLPELRKKIQARGLYLFSGPVGSGKTTLMYHLAQLKFSGQQVMSIEDPVEIKQEAMLQLQLNETIGMTYDSLIKLSLRHRPDLLIIGEIRDQETARAVVRASLTGATVFSTIHAKSVRGVYERLLELGVSEDELRMVLQGVCYQRLIGGGGVVDFVSQNYQEHEAAVWNQQIDQLFAEGHISAEQRQTEKIVYA